MRTVNTHSVTKHVASILAKYNRIYAFVLSAAVIIGCREDRDDRGNWHGSWRRHCCRQDRSLRTRGILLPAPTILERIGLAARARARKQAQRNLVEGLEQRTIATLEALIAVSDGRDRTALAWLRDWPEWPTQKNLVGVVERLQFVRSLGVGSDREQRISRAL